MKYTQEILYLLSNRYKLVGSNEINTVYSLKLCGANYDPFDLL